MSNEFLREVDDMVRAERIKSVWDNFKVWIIATVVLVFGGVMAFHTVRDYRAGKQDEQALTYWSLTQTEGEESQLKILQTLAADADMGYRTLAKFHLAGYWVSKDDVEKAVEVYTSIYADSAVPATLADIARLMHAQLQLESAPEQAEKMLKQLVANNSAYAVSALEFLAGQAESQGKVEIAKGYYDQMLQKADLPPEMRIRAKDRLAALGLVTSTATE